MKYTCPCCGHKTLEEEPPGTFNICPVCHWEDDAGQFADPDFAEGVNGISLREAQRNYRTLGVCEMRYLRFSRPPLTEERKDSEWSPLEP